MFQLPPLSLYIHVPWCVKKCPYCDFNSHTTQDIPEAQYLSQLKDDLSGDLVFVKDRPLQSIFIGGGTPSLMSGDFYQQLLDHIANQIHFTPDIEITMEANPGTFEAKRFKAYRSAGINRLSLGVQSFNDDLLENLGRIHNGAEALNAITELEYAGFSNFNIDLMHGLPGQTLEQALSDLEKACDLGPTHLSWYQLTIEQNTEFYRYPPKLPEDETLWAIQEKGAEYLAQRGFSQYEVSAYSKSGFQSRHNRNYWTYGDYLGIGAGAHAKVSNEAGEILRYRKTRLPADYLKCLGNFRRGEEFILVEDRTFEFMMNVLRLKEGVAHELFEQRTGLDFSNVEDVVKNLQQEGLLRKDQLATTERGMMFLNQVLERFV